MNAKEEAPPHLPVEEWIAVLAILLLMGGLIGVVLIERDQPSEVSHSPHYTVAQEFQIMIEGAVEKPGAYQVTRGTRLKELLEKAVPTADANLTRLNLDRVLRKGQVIKVPHSHPKKKPRKNKANV